MVPGRSLGFANEVTTIYLFSNLSTKLQFATWIFYDMSVLNCHCESAFNTALSKWCGREYKNFEKGSYLQNEPTWVTKNFL